MGHNQKLVIAGHYQIHLAPVQGVQSLKGAPVLPDVGMLGKPAAKQIGKRMVFHRAHPCIHNLI
jgi:hypothetical protein